MTGFYIKYNTGLKWVNVLLQVDTISETKMSEAASGGIL